MATAFRSNFVENTEQPEFEMYYCEDNNKALAERDLTLQKAGVKFTAEYYRKTYNL